MASFLSWHLFSQHLFFLAIFCLLASILSWHLFSKHLFFLGIYSLLGSILYASILLASFLSCIYSLSIYFLLASSLSWHLSSTSICSLSRLKLRNSEVSHPNFLWQIHICWKNDRPSQGNYWIMSEVLRSSLTISIFIPFSNFFKTFLQLRFWLETITKPESHNLAFPVLSKRISICQWLGAVQLPVMACLPLSNGRFLASGLGMLCFVLADTQGPHKLHRQYSCFFDATPQHMFHYSCTILNLKHHKYKYQNNAVWNYPHSTFAGHGKSVKHSSRIKAVAKMMQPR